MEAIMKSQNKIYKIIGTILIVVIAPIALFFSPIINEISLFYGFYITIAIMLIVAVLAFILSLGKRKPEPREFILIAVIALIAALSRIIFIPVPFVSPLVGIIIISGISLGPWAGFLGGAVSAVMCAPIMGMGPWVPWQMYAFGIAGFVGSLISIKVYSPKPDIKLNTKEKMKLAIIGYLIVQILVALVLDSSGTITTMMAGEFEVEGWIATVKSGAIVNFIHGVSVAVTIFFVARPMLEKLSRIKVKYGLMEEEKSDAF